MHNISTWDVAFYQFHQKSYTAIISFDSGLYLFNDQGQLTRRMAIKKTRALHWDENKLYCLSGNGVFQINGLDTVRVTPACQNNEQIRSFFHWNGYYYACTYPTKKWIQFKEQENALHAKWSDLAPWGIHTSILSHKSTDSLLYLGSEGAYYVIDKQNRQNHYSLDNGKGNNWVVWSIEECGNRVYLGLGDVHNLEQGAIIRHIPANYRPSISSRTTEPFIWGLTFDSTNQVLWASSLGKGCYSLLFPNQIHQIPIGRIFANQGYVSIWDERKLYVNTASHPSWITHSFPDNILDVQSCANRLFVLTQNWLYKWDEANLRFKQFFKISDYGCNKIIAAGYTLILHRPYAKWLSINIQTKQIEKWPNSSTQTAQFISTENFVITQDFDGSLQVVNVESRRTKSINHLTFSANTPLAISNNRLVAQMGQTWKVYQFVQNQLAFLFDVNIQEFILPNKEFKLFGTSRGFWILSNSHLYQIIFLSNGSVQMADQQYVGHLSSQSIHTATINNSHLWYYQSGYWKSIPLPMNRVYTRYNEFQLVHQNGDKEFVSKMSLNIQPNNDINVRFFHPEYWTHYHSLVSIGLKNDQDSFIHRQVRSGQEGNCIPGVPFGDYALFLSHQRGSQIAFLKTKTNTGLMALTLMVILPGMAILVTFRDVSKNAESQLTLLRWKTLKSNMNPHFLHNSMSLIQSLIAQQENKKAIEVTGKIAEINRLFLETNLQETATLEKELEFCRKYIQIESLRFSNKKFTYIEKIDPQVNLKEWSIPPLLFQPVIENAIKHGLLLNSTKGELILTIKQELEKNSLNIEISNTGPGPNFKRTTGTQMGSELVQQRLEHFNRLYQDRFKAQASSGFDPRRQTCYVFSLRLQKF